MHAISSALVIGLSKSGQAVVRFCLQKGIPVHGVDDKFERLETLPDITLLIAQGALLYHATHLLEMSQFSLIIVSPGVPNTHPLIQKAKQCGIEVIGEVELACRFLVKETLASASKNRQVLAITGTNGKTTVTLLVTHILNSCGLAAKAVGNIGYPLLNEVTEGYSDGREILVVELSSYQLETLSSQVIDSAVILNITPDHLDRYPSMEAYAAAKMHIASCLKPGGTLYVEEKTLGRYASLLMSGSYQLLMYGFSQQCNVSVQDDCLLADGSREYYLPSPYRGKQTHDVENLVAAYALCRTVGVTKESFFTGLSTFTKPPHRIEFIAEKKGVKFFDDSKGTNIDAVIKAVDTLRIDSPAAKIFLIAGGVDKGSAYLPWLEAFQGSVSAIYAIGEAAKKIESELGHALPVRLCIDMDQAVKEAAAAAQPGDSVLLSPGCASWDMFKDYAYRGEVFQAVVKKL